MQIWNMFQDTTCFSTARNTACLSKFTHAPCIYPTRHPPHQGVQPSRIERKSPAWTLFLPISRQACKISRINGKNPAKYVKSPASVGKNLRKWLPCKFSYTRRHVAPQIIMIIYTNHLTIKKDVKLSILYQMQNYLRQGDMLPSKSLYTYAFRLK